MTIHFSIPGQLKSFVGGRIQVDAETTGGTVRDALEALFVAHPAIRDRICTEQGEIREHVNVFVGNTMARYADGLATPIAEGEEISIIAAISGG
jgi:molybdopterin synthase sulfur carrier subunit